MTPPSVYSLRTYSVEARDRHCSPYHLVGTSDSAQGPFKSLAFYNSVGEISKLVITGTLGDLDKGAFDFRDPDTTDRNMSCARWAGPTSRLWI